jgi:hypothetical protein
MPRIIVTADPAPSHPTDTPVLLDEHVHSVHLSTDHAAAQLVERLAWAISDAEDAETARVDRPLRSERPAAARRASRRAATRQPATA